ADRLIRAFLHLQLVGNADLGLVDRPDFAAHGVRFQAVRLEDFDEDPRLADGPDARSDADAFGADAFGEGDDFLHARQFSVIRAFDLRRRVGDEGVRVLAAVTPGDFVHDLAIRPFSQAE